MARIRSVDERDYYLGGIKLDHVDVEKDQGVLVSHNLSWNNHLISLKAQRMLNVLYRTCKDLMILLQRNYFILPGFVRASVVWSPHTKRTPSTIWNKFKAGLQDSFLEGIILGMSALVS